MIDSRPAAIELRLIGTVDERDCLLTLVERSSGLALVAKLNQRPRKRYGYKTSIERLYELLGVLHSRMTQVASSKANRQSTDPNQQRYQPKCGRYRPRLFIC